MSIHPAKRNDLLELLRFLSCLFILLIHCPLPGIPGAAVIDFGRYGVPFFLMVSGWFSFSHDRSVMLIRAERQLRKTIRLIVFFTVSYCIMNSVCGMIQGGMPFAWVKNYCNRKTVLYFFLFNRALFFGSSAYYIFMLLYIYILFILYLRYRLPKYILYASPLLVLVNIFCGKYTSLPWFCYGNFLFTGIPCFALGHLLHKHNERFSRISLRKWVGLFVLGVFSVFFEAYTAKTAYCYFGSVLMAASLLMISVSNTRSYLPRIAQVSGRYATVIFIIHCGIRDILNAVFLRLDISCPEFLFPFVVIITSILFSILWDHTAQKHTAKRQG